MASCTLQPSFLTCIPFTASCFPLLTSCKHSIPTHVRVPHGQLLVAQKQQDPTGALFTRPASFVNHSTTCLARQFTTSRRTVPSSRVANLLMPNRYCGSLVHSIVADMASPVITSVSATPTSSETGRKSNND